MLCVQCEATEHQTEVEPSKKEAELGRDRNAHVRDGKDANDDLTIGVEAVNSDFERGAVYENLVHSLERWPVALFYIVAQGALAFHIWHGAWSLFQSLGVNNERFNQFRRVFASALTAITIVGFLAVPFAIQFGIVS